MTFLFAFGAAQATAAHIIGGEITYECLGPAPSGAQQYRFTMTIYRDCQANGANFDSAPGGAFPASITIWRPSGNAPVLTRNLSAPVVSLVNPGAGNPCLVVPPNVCVQKGVYTFTQELPIISESYFVVYQRCCRNNTITNIVDPGGTGATYATEITPTAQQTCNNSPTFDGFPPVVLCANRPFSFDFSATDIDGDQLVYELCAPLLGGGTNFGNNSAYNGLAPDPDSPPPYNGVSFQAPTYTSQSPLGPNAGLTINTTTGLMSGTPPLLGQFVVGICVSEYRNGELLSTVRRDFQFNVTPCTITLEANIQSDERLDDGTFVVNSCGDPTISFVNESIGQAVTSQFWWDFDLGDTTVRLQQWSPMLTLPGTGQYTGQLLLNPGAACSDTANILINVFPPLASDFSFAYDTCVAGPVAFTDLSVSDGAQIVSWAWDFADGALSAQRSPEHRYATPGQRAVQLLVTDNNNCQDLRTQLVTYFPVPNLIVVSPNSFVGCAPASIFFDNLSAPIDETYLLEWDFGDGQGVSNGDISPTHTFAEAGIFTVALSITSPIGCQTDTTFVNLIDVDPSPIADFSFSPEDPDVFRPEVQFADQSSGAWRWFWQFDGRASSIQQNPGYVFPDTGLQAVTLLVTHPRGCQDSITRFVDVAPKNTFFLPNAFTPNGDGTNDLFRGTGFLLGYKRFDLSVWNRWGQQVFYTSDPFEGWNGQQGNAGSAAPAGAYTYMLKMIGARGELISAQGSVVLIR